MEKTEMRGVGRLVALAGALLLATSCRAAASERGPLWKLGAGVRDSYYVNAGASVAEHAFLRAEHSVYSYEARYQYWRLYAGGMARVPYASFEGSVFYGRTWCGSYWSAGSLLTARVLPPGPVSVSATLNPLYDSGLKYHTCFAAGVAVRVCEPVSLVAAYTTIPEFRESEKRVRAGVEVAVGGLRVRPELSIPACGEHGSRRVRLLMSCSYTFSIHR